MGKGSVEQKTYDKYFKEVKAKMIGLLRTGALESEFVFMDEFGKKYIDDWPNYMMSYVNENSIYILYGPCEKYDEKSNIIPLFDDDGELKKEIFGNIKVRIIEMDRGYKPNTVFYGICKDKNDFEIIVKYGLLDRKKKSISIGEIMEISPFEIAESEAYNKNTALLEKYGNKNLLYHPMIDQYAII